MYQALYRKWRPRTFDDVVGQANITDTLKRQVSAGRLSHAYLFTGTRGTGKTTCAKILARAVNCEHPVDGNPCNACPACLGIENGSILDVLELDAASNNGVDQVRALRDEAVYTPAAVRKRVYIVDEVHMLSTAAFNALLKILEEPPEHLMFILATTELHKVPATIKSRCQQFSFQRILPTDIAQHLSYIACQEKIALTADAATLLSRLADGGMRDAVSLLDQCAGIGGTLGEAQVLDALGLAGNLETARLMGHLAQGETEGALSDVARLYGGGKDVSAILGELAALARDLLIRKTAPRSGAALLNGGYDETTLRGLSEQLTVPKLTWMLTRLQAVLAELPHSSNRRTDAEVCVLRLCDARLDDSAEGLSARIADLETRLSGGFAPPPVTVTTQPVTPPVQADADLPWETEVGAPAETPEKENRAAVHTLAPAMEKHIAASGDLLPALAAAVKNQVDRSTYAYLNNPAMLCSTCDGGVLTLWAENEVVKGTVGRQAVLEALSQAAKARLGSPVRVVVMLGKPEAAQTLNADVAMHDKLDDLLAFGQQFDNITIQ